MSGRVVRQDAVVSSSASSTPKMKSPATSPAAMMSSPRLLNYPSSVKKNLNLSPLQESTREDSGYLTPEDKENTSQDDDSNYDYAEPFNSAKDFFAKNLMGCCSLPSTGISKRTSLDFNHNSLCSIGEDDEITPEKLVKHSNERKVRNAELTSPKPSLVPKFSFDPVEDSHRVRRAIKGFGTREAEIIAVICHRSSSQRQEIAEAYKSNFNRDLIHDLKSELGGNLKRLIELLMIPRNHLDAVLLKKSMKGLGTDDNALIEVMCTRTPEELKIAKEAYLHLYGVTLEKDIKDDTSGEYRKLLVDLCQRSRRPEPEENAVDRESARVGARHLHRAFLDSSPDRNEIVRSMMATESWVQLRETFHQFQRLYNQDVCAAISKEFHGNLQHALLTIAECAMDRCKHFASRLHKSMKGLGTDDSSLIRLVVTRCEKDMMLIKQSFYLQYGQTLEKWIQEDTSGDYLKALLALL